MREISLSSGAVLKIGSIPFDTANTLKKVIIRDLKSIPIDSQKQVIDICKDYLCLAFGSEEVEKCLWECMKRCTYNAGAGDLKIDKETFMSLESRKDFTEIQFEVGKEALMPFLPGLFAVLQVLLAQVNTATRA